MPADSQIDTLLDQAADTVASNLEAIAALEHAKQASDTLVVNLQTQVQELQVKLASEIVLTEDQADKCASHIVRLGFITPAEKQAAVASLLRTPAKLVNMIDQLAGHVSSPMMVDDGSPVRSSQHKFAGQKATKSTSPWY